MVIEVVPLKFDPEIVTVSPAETVCGVTDPMEGTAGVFL
jgi:hypothetical protein